MDKMRRKALWGAGMALLLLVGCQGKKVAEVGKEAITQREFYEMLESMYGAEVLRGLILQKLVVQAAQQQGLVPSQGEVEVELQRLKQGFPSEDAYFRWLKQNGREETDLRRDLFISLALWKLQTKGLNPSEAQLRQFFEQNRHLFDQPERLRFHQIILATQEDADRVYRRLLEGIHFEALAKTDSIERLSGEQGGEVPAVPLEQLRQLQPDLFALLMGLKPGQVSKPTKIRFRNPQNWQQVGEVHAIVRLDERLSAQKVEFEAVKEQVRQAYLQQKARPREEVIAEVMRNAKVLIYSPRYRWLENEFGGQPILGEGLPTVREESEGGAPAPTPPLLPPTTGG